ncbi:NnrS family protein [Alcaligenaceae bacterium CGII-47]|nr:NnrS family protein [Alcaligenaceae bacterium CGII-47]
MPKLMHIEEAPSASAPTPSMKAFLALGFRPLYIAGAAWALISIALWVFAPQFIGAPLSGVFWHAHEMLWGFIITIAVGFLLTASATWTGFNPIHGRALGGLCVLWIVARIGYLFGGMTGFTLASIAEGLFFLIAAASLARVMVKGRSRRNYGIPLLILGLGVANALYLLAALDGNYLLLMQRFDLGLIGMAVVALLIARRVIPFFSMRMVPGLKLPMLTRSGHAQMVVSVIALLAGLAQQNIVMAVALAIVGVISLGQIAYWRPLAVLRKPMLWILYLGYAFIGIGLLAASVQLSGLGTGVWARSATHVHLIGMAGFCVLIIGMLTRTALGHVGLPLALDTSMLTSYYLMIAAVVFRLAALWPSAASANLLHLAGLAWVLAMGLYLWRFVPLLIRPRADKPQPVVAKAAPSASAQTQAN